MLDLLVKIWGRTWTDFIKTPIFQSEKDALKKKILEQQKRVSRDVTVSTADRELSLWKY
jgi:hypothetical protein